MADTGSAADTADPDGDAIINLLELGFRLDDRNQPGMKQFGLRA